MLAWMMTDTIPAYPEVSCLACIPKCQGQQAVHSLGSREALHQAGRGLGAAPSVQLLGKLGPARKPLCCCVEHERRDQQEA